MDWLAGAKREVWLLLAGLVVAGVLLEQGARRYRWSRLWWEARARRALWLFYTGHDFEAERMVERLGERAGWWWMRRVRVRLGLGLCRLARFEFAEALALLEPLGRSWGLRLLRVRYFYNALPGELAVCRAMVGDLAGAKRWLAEGYRRCGGFAYPLLLPEALILCREGEYGAAAKLLEDGRGRTDWCAGPPHLRRLLRAYALDRLDARRHEKDMRFLMLYVLSVYDPALETLVAYWPELGPFIKRWEPIVEAIMGGAPRRLG
jgi:hypothetical protein